MDCRYTQITERQSIIDEFKQFLSNFYDLNQSDTACRGIYVFGESGVGKTFLVKSILQELNYDMVYYDASDVRNKAVIDNLANNNMSDTNVLSMFKKNKKKIVIVMDEVDGMNNGDKNGINSLIKLIRIKKTKKQKKEEYTLNPIICISNNHVDKKIKELKKVCKCIQVPKPSDTQISEIIGANVDIATKTDVIKYVNGDLRKLQHIMNMMRNGMVSLTTLLAHKSSNDDTKQISNKLITTPFSLKDHQTLINETDRTSVALLFHENVIDVLSSLKNKQYAIDVYIKLLTNICYADYVDRITFQKQIWIFNEMTSLIKTFHNNKILHEMVPNINYNPEEVRFTKVLTKYATAYNNNMFMQNMCQILNVDKKDLYLYFLKLRETTPMTDIYTLFNQYDISNLKINRFYKLIDGTSIQCDDDSEKDVEENDYEEI